MSKKDTPKKIDAIRAMIRRTHKSFVGERKRKSWDVRLTLSDYSEYGVERASCVWKVQLSIGRIKTVGD